MLDGHVSRDTFARISSDLDLPKNDESTQIGTVLARGTDPIQGNVDRLRANRAITPRVIICGVVFARDQGGRIEEISVSASPYLIDHRWLEINYHGTRCKLAHLKHRIVACRPGPSFDQVRSIEFEDGNT
jgi:hypothetical protein